MKKEYDIEKLNPRKNPYSKILIKQYKHIIGIIVLIITALCILKFINYYKIQDYETKVLNFYNGISKDGISDITIMKYNKCLQIKNNDYYYDISPLIKNYIEQVEGKFNEPSLDIYDEYHILNMKAKNYNYYSIVQNYSKGLLLDINYGLNRIATISELETIIKHIGKDRYYGWQLKCNSNDIIELPYNFYLQCYRNKYYTKINKVLDCKFINSFIDYNYQTKNDICVTFLNDRNQEEKLFTDVSFDESNNLIVNFSSVCFVNDFELTYIELKNHFSDFE